MQYIVVDKVGYGIVVQSYAISHVHRFLVLHPGRMNVMTKAQIIFNFNLIADASSTWPARLLQRQI